MTCPTCEGYGIIADPTPSACPICYATGQEPSAASGDLVAARLRLRAQVLRACAEDPSASKSGARQTLDMAARTLAAALRAHGHPTPEHDQQARLMVRVLLSVGVDPHPFVGWVRPYLSRHARAEIVGRLAHHVPTLDALATLMGESHAPL